MRVGLDFDNTIVGYDALFHRAAVDLGLVPADLPASKLAVRDCLRAAGREPAWTELQGHVYGARMAEAEAFPGVVEFLTWAQRAGLYVAIVSHRTRRPFLGPPHDLHAAGRAWIARNLGPLVPEEAVFFEETKDDKLRRIAEGRFDCFVDDLPEILSAPGFPTGTLPILFGEATWSGVHMGSWSELQAFVAARC